jgi:hypothetical protein
LQGSKIVISLKAEGHTKMFCVNCGTQLSPELSYCNRCGTGLRKKTEPASTAAISAFLTAITILGIFGLGVMVGGALALSKEAGLPPGIVAVFMLFTFLIVGATEYMLIMNLSKLMGTKESKEFPAPPQSTPRELRPPQPGSLGEPVSVTENTTRTLEYSRREF